MSQKHYLSKEKKAELEAELEDLKTVKRREIAEKLGYARSLGDLSENAEYHDARTEQGEIEVRIEELETILKNVVTLTAGKGDVVVVGSTVQLKKKDGTKSTFRLVGAEEADISEGRLSYESPLGQAMMGKKEKESFSFETPSGVVQYTITDIE
jgi:transcription elongation factor GreA